MTEAAFRAAYAKATDADHLQALTGLGRVSVYNYCRRLSLPYLTDAKRQDLRKFTDERFLEVYGQSTSVADMASRLECSKMTVHLHLKKHGLKPPTTAKTHPVTNPIFNEYKGLVTVEDLKQKYGSDVDIRASIMKGVETLYRQVPPPPLPKPNTPSEVKVFHALSRHANARDIDVSVLGSSLGVSERVVVAYINRIPVHPRANPRTKEN